MDSSTGMDWRKQLVTFRFIDTVKDGDWWLFKGYPQQHTRYKVSCPTCGDYFVEHKRSRCRKCGKELAVVKLTRQQRFDLEKKFDCRLVAVEEIGYIFLKVDSDTLWDRAREFGLKPVEPVDLWVMKKKGRKVIRDYKVIETPQEKTARVFDLVRMQEPELEPEPASIE